MTDLRSLLQDDDEASVPTVDPMADLRNPDEVAQERQVADEVGEPSYAVRAYPQLFSQRAEAQRTDRQTAQAPRLRAWLADPNNSAVARDDIDALSQVERLGEREASVVRWRDETRAYFDRTDWLRPFRGLINLPSGLARPVARAIDESGQTTQYYQAGKDEQELSRLQRQRQRSNEGIEAPLTDEEELMLSDLQGMEQPTGGVPVVREGLRQIPLLEGMVERTLGELSDPTTAAGLVYSTPAGQEALRNGRADPRLLSQGRFGDYAQDLAAEGARQAYASLGSIPGSGAITYVWDMEAAGVYDTLVEQGVSHEIASDAAEQTGALNAAIEVWGAGLILGRSGVTEIGESAGVRQAIRNVTTRSALERAGIRAAEAGFIGGAEEGLQESVAISTEVGARARAGVDTPEDSNIAERYAESIRAGQEGGFALGSVATSANLYMDLRAVRRGEANQQAFADLVASANASRLRERLPSAAEQAVDASVAGTPIQTVRFDADGWVEHFQEQRIDPGAEAERVGVTREQLASALASGTDIEVRTGAFYAHLAATEPKLLRHARWDSRDFTQAEIEGGAQTRVEEVARGVVEEAVKRMDEGGSLRADMERRLRQIFTDAEKEGGPRPEVARKLTQVVASMPNAMVEIARNSANPAYADKLERDFRGFFEDRFDIAGPGREGGFEGAAELQQPENDGQNGDQPLGSNDGSQAPQDYQTRLQQVRSRFESARTQTQAGPEPGAVGGVREDAGAGTAGRAGTGARAVRGAQSQDSADVEAALSVSGIRIGTKPKTLGQMGDYLVTIDLPEAFSPELDQALTAPAGAKGRQSGFHIDYVDGSNPKDTRLPGVYLRTTSINDAAKGTRAGVWLYRQIIDWAHRKGLPAFSDFSISTEAQKIYPALERRGYRVTQINAYAVDPSDGAYVNMQIQPIYRIDQTGDETQYAAADVPDGDYQIDGPPLKEAISSTETTDALDLEQGDARGSIRYENFKAGEFGSAMIRMGSASDLSTFLHEFGHLGHLVLESIATDPKAPAEFKAMWNNTLAWWGLDQDQWAALSNEQKTPYFERWARTFEAYLMEGKAPSLTLREAFAAFKSWLTQIYRSVFRLDANLNPQIRDVFDRMLATDQEMAEARAAMGADFTLAREAFKTDEEFQQYTQAIAEARDAQEAELRARVMDTHIRKEKRWWRAERSRVRVTAEIEVDSDPARRAYEWLAFNEWRALPTEQNEEGVELPLDAALAMPEGLPEMRLDMSALDDSERVGLPEGLASLASAEDAQAALDNAMALKRSGRAAQPRRLWKFIKDAGGIKDEGGEITQALGSARSRPGLINNATGLDADTLALRAWEAGYFGVVPRNQLLQGDGPDAGDLPAGQSPDGGPAGARSSGDNLSPDGPNAGTRDAQSAWREELRSQGFDVDTPVFHGTASQFDTFDASRAGQVQKSDWGEGIYFAPSRESADYYRGEAVKRGDQSYNDAFNRYNDLDRTTTTWRGGTPTYSDEATAALTEFQRIGREIDRDTSRGRIVEGYIRMRNPLVERSEDMSWTDPGLAQRAREAGHDGIIIKNQGGHVEEIIIFDSDNFRPIDPPNNRQNTGDAGGSFEMFQGDGAAPENPLIAVHNTTAKKLQHAVRMGGMAVPSLAVVRADIGFDNFGDITLIAPPALVDPRSGSGARVFDADVYSPRYPQISHKVNERKFSALIERQAFQDASRDLGFKMSSELDESTTRQNGMDAILESTVIQLAYARTNGIDVEIPMVEGYREGEMRPDYYTVRRDLQERIGSDPAFMLWAEKEFRSAFEGERIFQGWTNAGNARYLPHNLDTVVRVLKRELRDGEGFNYGVGSIRSKVAREFRSLTAIKKSRDRIVDSSTMEALKNEANDEFVALANHFVERSGRTSVREQMGFLDTFSEHLKEVAETGRVSVMDQYYPSPLTDEEKAQVVAFLEKLRGLPTEYFEAKIRRAVGLNEFVAAVIPADTDARTIETLRNAGISDIRTYPKGNAAERQRALMEVRPNELFHDPVDPTRRPTPRELIDTLIDDIKNIRQVFSSKDEAAVARYQNRADALKWFEARDIDLSGTKEEIRSQIFDALNREAEEQAGGWHPDDIAPWFGFSSGDEMVQALKGLKPRAVAIEENIDARLEGEYGDPLKDGTVEEAANLAAHIATQARRIEIELEAIQRATGGRRTPVGKAARAYAERQVQHMTVKQLRGHDAFLAGERRAARNALEATQKKKFDDAAFWKQRQLIAFHLYRFARDAADEMDKAQRYFQKFDRDTIRAKIHAPLLDQIDQALEGVDLRAKPRISDRKRQSFLNWYNEMVAEGLTHQVAVDPDFLAEVQNKPFAALTLEEARGIRDAVRNFEHIGKRWREVLGERDARLLDEAVAEMSASMAEVKPFEIANPANHSAGAVESIDRMRQGAHAHLSRVESVARAMDRGKDNGPVWNGLFRPLTEARDREETRQAQAQETIERLFSVYTPEERADMWVKRKFYPQVPNRDGSRMGRNFTKQEILALALNTGNEYNLAALLEGERRNSGMSEQQLRALLDSAMDARDWRFVQSAWDYVESFWPEIEALYVKSAGVAPAKVKPTPFTNRYGEWPGGYWHLEYDYGRDQRVRDEMDFGAVQEAFGGFRTRTQTPNGFSKARQGSGGRPVRLELSILTEHVNEVIHDLEFRMPVLNVWRLVKHSAFREAFVRAAGQEMYDTLKPWLQYTATERMPPERMFAGVIKTLRRNTPIALMGYAVGTIAQQPAGIMATFHRVGTARVMSKMLELSAQPWRWMDHARFINARSAFMSKYATISQRELREMVAESNSKAHLDAVRLLTSGTASQKVQALGYINRSMQRFAMFPLAFVNKWVASVAWQAAYEKALAGRVDGVSPNNEADVVAYADQMIRTTFGSGRPEDLPPVMRSSEIEKMITPAFSYFSTQYNAMFNEQAPGMMRGQISPLEFTTFILWTIIIQALASQWLAGRWEPDDDESEEERNLRLAMEVAITPTAGIPLVRDMSRGVARVATTGEAYGFNSVPALGALTATGTGVGGAINDLAEEGEISRRSARDLTMASGYWFGLPSRQMWTTGSYVSDVVSGKEEAPWDAEDPVEATSEALLRDTR